MTRLSSYLRRFCPQIVSPRPGAAPLFFCWLSTPSGPTNQTLPLGDFKLLPKVSEFCFFCGETGGSGNLGARAARFSFHWVWREEGRMRGRGWRLERQRTKRPGRWAGHAKALPRPGPGP